MAAKATRLARTIHNGSITGQFRRCVRLGEHQSIGADLQALRVFRWDSCRRCPIAPGSGSWDAGRGSRRITQHEYDRKARELKERQAEITTRIDQHQDGEGSFRITLEKLISVVPHGRPST